MTKVINLFSGPSTGKSTISAEIFSTLKWKRKNVELVREYAKDKVWESSYQILENQLKIFSEQFHRQYILNNKVEYIITDSPLLLSLVYGKNRSETFEKLVLERFNEFNNINYYLVRNKPYCKYGRYQTESQAKKIDKMVLDILIKNNIPFTTIDGDEFAYKKIIDRLEI